MNVPRALFLAVVVTVTAGACRHRAGSAGEVPASPERIVHGVVSVTGTAQEQQLVLETGNGPLRLHASPADSAALVNAQTTEVSVHGVDQGNALRVHSFTVTRVGNAPVVDGVVRRVGDRLLLETAEGRFALGNPPAAFWQLVGARVWVQGPLDLGPNAYGVIRR